LVLGKPARVLSVHELAEARASDDWAIQRDRMREEIFRNIEIESQD